MTKRNVTITYNIGVPGLTVALLPHDESANASVHTSAIIIANIKIFFFIFFPPNGNTIYIIQIFARFVNSICVF